LPPMTVINNIPITQEVIIKRFFWRGNSLWVRFSLEGYPPRFPLGIKRISSSKTEIARCLKLGEEKLAALRAETSLKGTVFDRELVESQKEYNPSFCALCLLYYHNKLKYKKSGKNEWYHLQHSFKRFGKLPAKSIRREDIEVWRQEQKLSGVAVNTINNRFAYLQAVYAWSNQDPEPEHRLNYDPTVGLQKLSGAKVRTFVLTEEKFERNYLLLRDGRKWPAQKPNKHCTAWQVPPDPRFALFYLALWETGRRPEEVSQYTWDMVTTLEIDGSPVRFFFVSPELAKTDEPDQVVISDRLWHEIQSLGYRHGLIFRNANGDQWKHWDRHHRKLELVYGKDAGWIRDCRRGFVTHRTEVLGCDPRHVRMQSGHKTESVFNRYRIGQLKNQTKVVETGTNLAHFPERLKKNA
jgi:hypothetical protein